MNKISTAEEILQNKRNEAYFFPKMDYHVEAMIEFAKLHVETALKEASEKATAGHSYPWTHSEPYVNEDSILNAYPLDNIK